MKMSELARKLGVPRAKTEYEVTQALDRMLANGTIYAPDKMSGYPPGSAFIRSTRPGYYCGYLTDPDGVARQVTNDLFLPQCEDFMWRTFKLVKSTDTSRRTPAADGSKSIVMNKANERSERVLDFVNELAESEKLDFSDAWNLAKLRKPSLFANMQKPSDAIYDPTTNRILANSRR
jgi:hypothetical protein